MANKIIGKAMEGRQYKTDGSNNNARPIEIEAPIGDGATANSATPFLKFTGTDKAGTEDGRGNLTSEDVTNNTTSGGVLVEVGGSQYWLPLYATA